MTEKGKALGEFIAEGWAEYMNNPQPRPIVKAIGERLEELYDKKKKEWISQCLESLLCVIFVAGETGGRGLKGVRRSPTVSPKRYFEVILIIESLILGTTELGLSLFHL